MENYDFRNRDGHRSRVRLLLVSGRDSHPEIHPQHISELKNLYRSWDDICEWSNFILNYSRMVVDRCITHTHYTKVNTLYLTMTGSTGPSLLSHIILYCIGEVNILFEFSTVSVATSLRSWFWSSFKKCLLERKTFNCAMVNSRYKGKLSPNR